MILRAKMVLPVSAPPIENGAVAIEGDTITAVGPSGEIAGGETRDLGEVVLAPGLINAHCHLEYTRMRGELEWRGSFIEWILALVALKKIKTEKDYITGIERGIDELARSGTTTIVNITSFPDLIDTGIPVPLRVIWCLELIDFGRTQSAKAIAQTAMEFIAARPNMAESFGLSPHAPYTASGELYRLAADHARSRHMPLTTHVGESQEEDDMIRRGTGPMYDYFLRAGRGMRDCKRHSPVQLLAAYAVLGENCIAAHANCLSPIDIGLLAKTKASVVHCPKTHRFFRRDTPLIHSFWQQGVNVCLGTDSLASNDTLNMFAEMQTFSRIFPDMSAQEILPMATTAGAKALNLGGKIGSINTGAWADLIAVPLDGNVDPYEAVVYAEKPVTFSMVNGKIIYVPEPPQTSNVKPQ
jgi:cytosine/adenosine deaminase-related metal-dependent hydrolase